MFLTCYICLLRIPLACFTDVELKVNRWPAVSHLVYLQLYRLDSLRLLTHLNVAQVAVYARDRCQQQGEQLHFLSLHLAVLQKRCISMSGFSSALSLNNVSPSIPAFWDFSQIDLVCWTPVRGMTPGWSCIQGTCLRRLSGKTQTRKILTSLCVQHNGLKSLNLHKKSSSLHHFGQSAAPRCLQPEISSVRRINAPAVCFWRADVAVTAAPQTSGTSDWITTQKHKRWSMKL